MTASHAADALRQLLLRLPERIPVEQIDRLWLFPVRNVGTRESGLVVISTLPAGGADGPRRVLTLRYELEPNRDGFRASDALAEQGTAPADHVDRVIEGVIRRLGDDAGDPVPHRVAGELDRWSALLHSLDPAAVDPTSGE